MTICIHSTKFIKSMSLAIYQKHSVKIGFFLSQFTWGVKIEMPYSRVRCETTRQDLQQGVVDTLWGWGKLEVGARLSGRIAGVLGVLPPYPHLQEGAGASSSTRSEKGEPLRQVSCGWLQLGDKVAWLLGNGCRIEKAGGDSWFAAGLFLPKGVSLSCPSFRALFNQGPHNKWLIVEFLNALVR